MYSKDNYSIIITMTIRNHESLHVHVHVAVIYSLVIKGLFCITY